MIPLRRTVGAPGTIKRWSSRNNNVVIFAVSVLGAVGGIVALATGAITI